jgi:hypothetical protein
MMKVKDTVLSNEEYLDRGCDVEIDYPQRLLWSSLGLQELIASCELAKTVKASQYFASSLV